MDINFNDMMIMQKELFELHKDKWSPMEAQYGRNFILWMIEEVGETISIIKKKGDNAIMNDKEVRAKFVEEMSDIMMYYVDTLLRYGVSANEIASAYVNKHEYDMKRNYDKERSAFIHQTETNSGE
ncbi:MAG: nucleotide pyrophosphohydrolase [Clostridia bacterium]